MNVAIGIGTLLLGGWVMPDSGSPQPDLPTQRFEQPSPGGRPEMPKTRPSSGSPSGTRSTRQGGDEEPSIPLSPTDPSPDSSWPNPTQTKPGGPSTGGYGTRSSPGGNQGMNSPRPQRTQSTRPARSYGSSSAAGRPVFRPNVDLIGMQQAPTPHPETGPKPQASGTRMSKPFEGYKAPSGVSPYMNLFRFDPVGGVQNNYNMYVQPQLEQNRANQVLGGQIRGLQSGARLQTSALQRLGKKTDNLGGTMAPEYFQNLGNYYPGLAH
jgi:hypothetical protein